MATTELHPIRSTLHLALAYITKAEKTEDGMYVQCYGCSRNPYRAANEFLETRKMGSGRGDVLAQHLYVSYRGKEVTPEVALEIGNKLADKLLKGEYQYTLAAHIDTNNIHFHIIFNNVSFENFKTFETNENQGKIPDRAYARLRKISDDLCREYGLTVIENPEKNEGKKYYEWQQDKLGKSWKSQLRNIIDETIMESEDFEDFLSKIRAKNIECVYTPDKGIKIKFRMQGQERFSRGKTLGWYYDAPQIQKRIEQFNFLKSGVSERNVRTKIIDTSQDVFQTSKGLLNWAEIQNMQEASRMINFLSAQGIKNEQELDSKGISTYNERMVLVANLDNLQQEIDHLSDKIKALRIYKKYKPMYEQYRKSGFKENFKKENALVLEKYEYAVKSLNEFFPDKKLPVLERIEQERTELIEKRKHLNEKYKQTITELKEIEYARSTLNDYLKNVDRSRKRGNGELE